MMLSQIRLRTAVASSAICISITLMAISLASVNAATYYVAQRATNASDTNPGTLQAPWKTISRAGRAKELKPGDIVLINSGIYREHAIILVSGQNGRPITFAAAPGARVVLKGSEPVRGRWSKLTNSPTLREPYPNAFANVWKISLGEEFFKDFRFYGVYRNKSQRWVSQVFIQDDKPLQRIGTDPIYKNKDYLQLTTIGTGLKDLIQDSFYFDASNQTLFIRIAGDPGWYSIEVGVRGFVLTAQNVHDVVLRGLEMRHNRQPGGQWSMVALSRCERIMLEDCRIYLSDFAGVGLGRSTNCIVRKCDITCNGNTGLAMGDCDSCTVEQCTLLFNNYRHFNASWVAGGMKCIPANRHCVIRGCEAAYNIDSPGIWFDSENADIRIIGNVAHHNGGCGTFFEINKGGGVIADNLVYANRDRGIYVSGSQNTWVVHNTVVGNHAGIVCMPRGPEWPLENVQVFNNLLIRNTIADDRFSRGSELTLFMDCPGETRTRRLFTNHSDYNVYADSDPVPSMRHTWNPDNTLAQWQQHFGEDRHSKIAAVKDELRGTGFKLLSREEMDIAGPLPLTIGWQSSMPKQVGSSISQWP